MHRLTWILWLALAAGSLPVHAQLEFEKPENISELSPHQDRVTASFAFRNAGPKAVTIVNVQTTCGCTTATLKQRTYAPGESGAITAELRAGATPGRVEKKVLVKTDEPDREPYALTIGAVVPLYLSLDPAFLKWEFGADPTPKTVNVKVGEKFVIRVTAVHSSDPAWTTELSTVKEGAAYAIVVKPPANMNKAGYTTLTLETDFPKDKPLVFSANARVTQPRTKPKTNWLLELFR